MYQFFVEENQLAGDKITILGSDVNHIRNVLRMKGGERVRVSLSGDGRSFFGMIENITEDEVTVSIESEDEASLIAMNVYNQTDLLNFTDDDVDEIAMTADEIEE